VKGEMMKKLIAIAAVAGLLTVIGCSSHNQGGAEMDQNYGNTPGDAGSSSVMTNSVAPSTTSPNSSYLNGNTGGTGTTPGGNSSGTGSSTSDNSNQGNVPNSGSNTNLNNNGQPPQ
jgi:hypothetical protein